MATGVTREESRVATRIDTVEREVEGEKIISRHILEQTRRSGDDLAATRPTERAEILTERGSPQAAS